MNADQLAEICDAIREVAEGAPHTCATLEAEGDSEKWLQLVDKTINAAYPHSDSPDERVMRSGLPSIAPQLLGWEAGLFATFEFAQLEEKAVAEWIDAYFVRVLGCTDGAYQLDIAFQDL